MEIHKIGLVNVYSFLVGSRGSRILIDTGHVRTTNLLESFLKKEGVSADEIKLILLTHTHYDHAGGAAFMKKLTGAPLAIHQSEKHFLEKGYTPIPKGTRWKSKLMSFVGRNLPGGFGKYPALKADIEIESSLDLKPFGIAGRVEHTPGHTEGSLSVFLESGEAFVGDNALGILRKEHFPPFANDIAGVLNTWERYIESEARVLYPGHGKAFSIDAMRDELPRAREKYLAV